MGDLDSGVDLVGTGGIGTIEFTRSWTRTILHGHTPYTGAKDTARSSSFRDTLYTEGGKCVADGLRRSGFRPGRHCRNAWRQYGSAWKTLAYVVRTRYGSSVRLESLTYVTPARYSGSVRLESLTYVARAAIRPCEPSAPGLASEAARSCVRFRPLCRSPRSPRPIDALRIRRSPAAFPS